MKRHAFNRSGELIFIFNEKNGITTAVWRLDFEFLMLYVPSLLFAFKAYRYVIHC